MMFHKRQLVWTIARSKREAVGGQDVDAGWLTCRIDGVTSHWMETLVRESDGV